MWPQGMSASVDAFWAEADLEGQCKIDVDDPKRKSPHRSLPLSGKGPSRIAAPRADRTAQNSVLDTYPKRAGWSAITDK